jgi:hypothetical protein
MAGHHVAGLAPKPGREAAAQTILEGARLCGCPEDSAHSLFRAAEYFGTGDIRALLWLMAAVLFPMAKEGRPKGGKMWTLEEYLTLIVSAVRIRDANPHLSWEGVANVLAEKGRYSSYDAGTLRQRISAAWATTNEAFKQAQRLSLEDPPKRWWGACGGCDEPHISDRDAVNAVTGLMSISELRPRAPCNCDRCLGNGANKKTE